MSGTIVKQTGQFDYTPAQYAACLEDSAQCYLPADVDYERLLDADEVLRLCERYNEHEFDEVWLLGGPSMGISPSRLAGQGVSYWSHELVSGTGCTRPLPGLGFDYLGAVAMMKRDLVRRLESALNWAFVPLDAADRPDDWDEFLTACGAANDAPNTDVSDDFDDLTQVTSSCDDFTRYPALPGATTELDCTAWGCSEVGYSEWWLRHLPTAPGFGADYKFNDWWLYGIDPVAAAETVVECSGRQVGYECRNVLDDRLHGCERGEWALPGTSSGWIKIAWHQSRLVSSVTLYGRGCGGQVTSGYVELNNRQKTRLHFDNVENGSNVQVNIGENDVSAVSVHITGSLGGDAGFSEIDVN